MSYKMPPHFSARAFEAGYSCAVACSAPQKGWVRLGSVQGSAVDPYVIATRTLKDGRVQFSCGCPHWRYRCQSAGKLCKHQLAFLMGDASTTLPAGKAFLSAMQKVVFAEKAAA